MANAPTARLLPDLQRPWPEPEPEPVVCLPFARAKGQMKIFQLLQTLAELSPQFQPQRKFNALNCRHLRIIHARLVEILMPNFSRTQIICQRSQI